MRIVIIGGGEIGFHVAERLSREKNNITLIDIDEARLTEISHSIDVRTRLGSGSDWRLLDELLFDAPSDMFLALTGSDELNLLSCAIAKNLGYPKTLARVKDNQYMNRSRLDFGHIFATDYLICPEIIVADEISSYIFSQGFHMTRFAHGAVEMRTFVIPSRWRHREMPVKDFHVGEKGGLIALIRRPGDREGADRLIFPHGDDILLPKDEITVIGETERMEELHAFFGGSKAAMPSVLILGGSRTGLNLAKILEKKGMHCRIVDKSPAVCAHLAEELKISSILLQDGTDIHFLKNEKVGAEDVVVACTESDEANIIAAYMAQELGAQRAVAFLSSNKYQGGFKPLGIAHMVSLRVEATDRILSYAKGRKISSMTSLYDEAVEVFEVNVSLHSPLVGIPINELSQQLPKDFLIAAIQNRGRVMIAHGRRILSPGDTVIIVSKPQHREFLETYF
ncbi:MAG: trkA [Chlamydiales bacterium]|jgi:trk system potassium uptake protein TrkA|nr:trkA [Chlamydiales bacterium]